MPIWIPFRIIPITIMAIALLFTILLIPIIFIVGLIDPILHPKRFMRDLQKSVRGESPTSDGK